MVCQEGASVETPAGPYPTLLGCKCIWSEPEKDADLSKAPEQHSAPSEEGTDPKKEEEEAKNREDAKGNEPAQGSAGEGGEPEGEGSPERSVAKKQQEDFWMAASKALEERARREQVQAFLKQNGFTGVGTTKNGWMFSYTYPLHRAVEQNDPNLVSALLKSNAEAHVRNSEGKTPRQLAKSLNFVGSHAEVLKVLKRDRKPGPGAIRKARLAAAAAAVEAAERLPGIPEVLECSEAPCTKFTAEVAAQCNFDADEAV